MFFLSNVLQNTEKQVVQNVCLKQRHANRFPLRHTLQSAPLSKLPKADTPSDGIMTPGSIKSRKNCQLIR